MSVTLLYGLHECGLPDTHFISTTTAAVYGAPHFPTPEAGPEVAPQGGSP